MIFFYFIIANLFFLIQFIHQQPYILVTIHLYVYQALAKQLSIKVFITAAAIPSQPPATRSLPPPVFPCQATHSHSP